MVNPIKEIVRFNKEADMLDKGYDDFLESSFQVEEALEGFPQEGLDELAGLLSEDHYEPQIAKAKDLSRTIVHIVQNSHCVADKDKIQVSNVDRLDKACDAVVFAVGSMAKLGLSAQEITKALNVVMHKNFEKIKCPKDEHGKLTKPADFIGPEDELQKILDSASNHAIK